MKTLSILLLSFLFASHSNAEKIRAAYSLQIKTEGTDISYPPNTKFELYDSNNILIYTQEDLPQQYEITSLHRLVLHPSWRETEETYRLEKATLVLNYFDAEYWMGSADQLQTDQPEKSHSDYITAAKTLSKSLLNENKYNLTLTFNNGLIFSYVDGQTEAIWEDKPIEIQGRYVIKSELGTYKISFNPANGETWWVFNTTKK